VVILHVAHHAINPLLDQALQLCMHKYNRLQHLLDAHAECSNINIHLLLHSSYRYSTY